jgi:putative transposase
MLLKKHQRRLSRKVKGSNRYKLQKEKLAKIHYKIANQRKDFLHKLSTILINENQVIYLEDLNIKDMMQNNSLSKSISDVSWYEFIRQLKYKADWYGRKVIQIDRYEPTSKKCNCCGWINGSLNLEIREWNCLICGMHHDRDVNAAINIFKTGKDITKEDVELLPLGRAKKRQINTIKV